MTDAEIKEWRAAIAKRNRETRRRRTSGQSSVRSAPTKPSWSPDRKTTVTGRSTAAGYGWAHQQQVRASWGSLVATGKVRCAPSGEPIQAREYRRNSHDHHR